MPKDNPLGHRHSPEEQLAGFSRTGLGKYIVLAIVVHAIVIVATSVAYLRGWADPEWKQQQEIAEQQAAEEAVRSQEGMQQGKALQEERKAEQDAKSKADLAAEQTSADSAKLTADSAKSKAAELDAKIEKAFAEAGIDRNDPLVKERLSDVPKERWISKEIIDSVRPAQQKEIPASPGDLLDISIDDTN